MSAFRRAARAAIVIPFAFAFADLLLPGEWVQNLTRMEADLEEAVSAAVEAAQKPWWR